MREPMWMYWLAVDADGVVVAAAADKEAVVSAATSVNRECHVYRVDKWTRVWTREEADRREKVRALKASAKPGPAPSEGTDEEKT